MSRRKTARLEVIAHDARNSLGALTNCVELLRGNPCLTGEDAELLAIIEGESRRLNEIVSDLLAFGRPLPRRLTGDWGSPSSAGSSRATEGASR